MRKLSVGDKVSCQYYNTPDRRFYGEFFEAEVLRVPDEAWVIKPKRDYLVRRLDNGIEITLHRKEIKRRIK